MKNEKVSRRKLGQSRRGAATIEMACVAPIILLLIFGSIEFGRMMMVRQAMTNSAREACRHACLITTSNASAVAAVANETVRGVIYKKPGQDAVRVTVNPSFTTPPASGTKLVTTVEVDCADVSWLPNVFYAGAKIRVVASMFRE